MKITALLLTAFVTSFVAPAFADGDDDEKYGLEALMEARRAGDVLPLIDILERIEPIIGDNVVDIEFERDDGRFKYGIYYLDARGRRHEVYVDAQSGDILEHELDD